LVLGSSTSVYYTRHLNNLLDLTSLSRPDTGLPFNFSSLQDQLGLKLKPDEVLDEFFIIDSAEKPSEN
jgi:uncharacterized protein (TIGR03435 family)